MDILNLLKQYESIMAEIDDLKKEREQRDQVRTDTVSGSSPEWPYCKHSITIRGRLPLSPELDAALQASIESLERKRIEIENFLATVQDSKVRRIIRLKYIEKESWQQVAFSIGHHDEQYPRRILQRFIECTKCTDLM